MESGSEVILANIAKPSKTAESIAQMEVPRSRNLRQIIKISIERQSFGRELDEEPPTSDPN